MLFGGLNGRVGVCAVLHRGMHLCGMRWNKAPHLHLMEVRTLQESINQGVEWGQVKPSGGDSILDDPSWSAASKCGLEIFSMQPLTFMYLWVMEKPQKKIQGVDPIFGFKIVRLLQPYNVLQRFLVDTCTSLVQVTGTAIWYSSRFKSRDVTYARNVCRESTSRKSARTPARIALRARMGVAERLAGTPRATA